VTQIDILRNAVRRVRARTPFRIDAWVVLPDHMHCLWTLPRGDADFPGRWRAIKTAFVKCLPTGESRSPVMTSRGERGTRRIGRIVVSSVHGWRTVTRRVARRQ
jgi:putative transposase